MMTARERERREREKKKREEERDARERENARWMEPVYVVYVGKCRSVLQCVTVCCCSVLQREAPLWVYM